MNDQSDQQLLRDYAERQTEAAFATLVNRYVDLVYSAAFRMVCDVHAAKDVTQSVFVALSENARQLTDRPALAGWLHGTARNLAAKAVRSEVRRRAREQEAAVMNNLLSAHPEATWEHIAPHLDEALGELDDTDRDAVLLRYFKNHDLRTVGSALGISDDAAQKRVSRAVERLREFFAKRGATIGASGLAVVISANAVQAAPVGLAVTISASAALVGATVAATATATATITKTIAMTTLQKTIIGTALAATIGTGIYEARQASQLREQNQFLQEQQTPLAEQIQQLQQERDDATNSLILLRTEIESLKSNASELPKLRAEVTRLRRASAELANLKGGGANNQNSVEVTGDASQLTQEAVQLWQSGRPAQAIPKFEAALKLDPGNLIAWNGLGWANFNSGKRAAGEAAFQKVIELEPDHPAALNGLGQIYLLEKKYPEAESYLLKASAKAPAAWYGLTKLYLLQDKFEQAEKWAQTIIDSGQADESTRAMLKAAKDRQVSDALRLMIEPQ